MADTPQTVPIPAGATVGQPQVKTVPIPTGATVDATRGAREATGLGPNTGRRSDDPVGRAMDTAIDAVGGAVAGAGKGLLSTVGGATELAGEAINRIPGVGETLAPRAGLDEERRRLQAATKTEGMAEAVGGAIEEGGEWMAGDAGLKALSKLGKISKFAPKLLVLAEKYPTVAKLLFGSAKGAVVGGAQAAAKAPAEGKDVGAAFKSGAEGGAIGGGAGEVLDAALSSKGSRSLVNRSLGATARDVTYGNPAKALLDEGIKSPLTGDIEAYKSALRAGKSEAEAAQAAGGRLAGVSAKIEELEPQLTQVLKSSTAKISVKEAILDPVYDATKEILDNRAMTKSEKDAAIDKLLELQHEMIQGLGKDITPEQAVKIKRDIGDRVNWSGTTAVTDEVKPVYKKLYGSLKNQIHEKVPEAASLDERLTNLFPAKKDLMGDAAKGEIATGSGLGAGGWLGILEKGLGRIVPAAAALAKNKGTKAALGLAGEKLPDLLEGHVRFMDSDGNIHDVPQEGLAKAREIDHGLKVMD